MLFVSIQMHPRACLIWHEPIRCKPIKCDHVIVDKTDRIACTQEIGFCSAGPSVTHFLSCCDNLNTKDQSKIDLQTRVFTECHNALASLVVCCSWPSSRARNMWMGTQPWCTLTSFLGFGFGESSCFLLCLFASYLFPPSLQHSNKPEQFWPSIGGVWEWNYQVDILNIDVFWCWRFDDFYCYCYCIWRVSRTGLPKKMSLWTHAYAIMINF